MIGRFTKQGTYRELLDIHDVLRVVFGGLLTPIMGAVVHNIGSVLVVLSSASIAFAGD